VEKKKSSLDFSNYFHNKKKKNGYFKNSSLKGVLGNQKLRNNPFGTLIFGSLVSIFVKHSQSQ